MVDWYRTVLGMTIVHRTTDATGNPENVPHIVCEAKDGHSASADGPRGNPLTFELTGGEVHETQGFDALMELHDVRPPSFSATRATTATTFAITWQSKASSR